MIVSIEIFKELAGLLFKVEPGKEGINPGSLKCWKDMGGINIDQLILDELMFYEINDESCKPYPFKYNFDAILTKGGRECNCIILFAQTKLIENVPIVHGITRFIWNKMIFEGQFYNGQANGMRVWYLGKNNCSIAWEKQGNY